MPQTIEGITGKDLLRIKSLQSKAAIEPDQIYSITLYTKEERSANIEEMERAADQTSREAQEKGLTPEKFGEILNIGPKELERIT